MDLLQQDEDSFVVLGTSPTPSMDYYDKDIKTPTPDVTDAKVMEMSSQTDTSLQNNLTTIQPNNDDDKVNAVVEKQTDKTKELSLSSSLMQDQMIEFSLLHNEVNELLKSANVETENLSKSTCENLTDLTNTKTGNVLGNNSKSNVFETFPSLRPTDDNMDDIQKLQNLLCEHYDLKDNLQKTNLAMRQHFSTINKWLDVVKIRRTEQDAELLSKTNTIEQFQEENVKLKIELEMLQETIHSKEILTKETNCQLEAEITQQKNVIQELQNQFEKKKLLDDDISLAEKLENEKKHSKMIEKLENDIVQLKKELQEKTEIIEGNIVAENQMKNSCNETVAQYEKLIMDLHMQLEMLKTKSIEKKTEEKSLRSENCAKSAPNSISSDEYEVIIKQLKNELSRLLAENLEIQDMKKQFIDELECCRVNLNAAEELSRENNNKNALLEAKTADMEKLVTEKNKTIIELRNQIKTAHDMEQIRLEKLQTELIGSKELFNATNSVLMKTEQANKDHVKSLDEMNGKLNDLFEENKSLKEQKGLYVNELQKLQINLAETMKINNKMVTELNELKNDNDTYQLVLKAQESEINALQSEAKLLEAEKMISFQKELTDTQKNLNETKSALERVEQHKVELTKLLDETKKICDALKEKNTILQEQLNVYKQDYDATKKAHIDIANEREEIISDLKLLQRRNEQLMNEKQQRPFLFERNSSGPSKEEYSCPICKNIYSNLSILETHVQICLEN